MDSAATRNLRLASFIYSGLLRRYVGVLISQRHRQPQFLHQRHFLGPLAEFDLPIQFFSGH